MKLTFSTRKRRLLIATGQDAHQAEQSATEWVQLNSADLSIAPEHEQWVYEDDEDEEIPTEMGTRTPGSFGFAPPMKSNIQ